MKTIARVTCIVVGALLLVIGAFGTASADGVIPWQGHGAENLPCDNGGHWVLAPAFGIDPNPAPVLTVNGSDYVMSQNGNGSWSADSVGPLDANLTAWVSYTGNGDERDSLQLSSCNGSPVPTPTDTAVPPTPTDTSVPPTPTETVVPPTPTNTVVPPTPTETVVPTATSTGTPGPSPTATNTPVPTSTNTPGPSPTATNTPVPTVTNTPGPSLTPTATPPEKNTAGGTPSGSNPNIIFGLLGVALIALGIFFPKIKANNFAKK